MKKLLMILLPVLLVAILVVIPVIATPDAGVASVGDATGKPGETVDITLSLSNFTNLQSVALACEVPEGLKLESGQWLLSGGIMSDVNTSKKTAVWMTASSVSLTDATDALKLSFKIQDLVAGQEDFTYEVKLTVTVLDDEGKRALDPITATVTVSEPATALELSENALTIDLANGNTATLSATLTPVVCTDKVVWTSGDETVITVANGVLTALKRGTATVTATAGAVSDQCVVTVVCGHDLTEYPANPATCQSAGNNLYYVCNVCGDVLAADQTTLTTVEAETLAKVTCSGGTASCTAQAICSMCGQPYGEKLPHVYETTWTTDESNHWHKCQSCDDAADLAAHTFNWVVDSPATEDVTGLKHEECACGYKRNEGTVIDKLDHVHVGITRHDAIAATCVATGNVEYWTCSSDKCAGKYFGDADCQTELTTITVEIDGNNHVGGTTLKGDFGATCGAVGYTGDTHCASCDAMLEKGSEIPATGEHTPKENWLSDESQHWQECAVCGNIIGQKTAHVFNWIVDSPATEDVTGLKHEECACGYKRNEGTVIDKLDHVHVGITRHDAVSATCIATGTVEYWTCSSSKCTGKYYGDADCQTELTTITEPINANNHVGGTTLKGYYGATCGADGYSGDTHCASCDALLAEGAAIGATGEHTPKADWITSETQHWQECADCNAVIGAKVNHTFNWVVDSPATEDVTGLKHEECVCGYKRNEGTVIDKLDHVHVGITHYDAVKATCVATGTVEYWTCSSDKCAGKYYGDENCQTELTTVTEPINAANHVGGTTVKGYYGATCGTAGYTGDTYCASCDALLETGEAISATGEHTAKDGWVTSDSQHWQECADCGSVVGEKAAHALIWVEDQAPTEDVEGKQHQVCETCGYVCNEGTPIDKLVHDPKMVEAVDATCSETGLIEHFFCRNCRKYYASVDGQIGEEIDEADTVVDVIEHTFDTAWSSNEDGHWHGCTCGEKADFAAHTPTVVGKVEATDDKTGYTGDTVCADCGYLIELGEVTGNPTTGPNDLVLWLLVPMMISGAALMFLIWNKKRQSV